MIPSEEHDGIIAKIRTYVSGHPHSVTMGIAVVSLCVVVVAFILILSEKDEHVLEDTAFDDTRDVFEEDEHVRGEAFEGFTHFPFDFEEAFDGVVMAPWGHVALPILHDFYPPAKVGGARKWYTDNPHSPVVWDEETNVYTADWETYLVADATIRADGIQVDVNKDYEDVFGSTLRDMSLDELLADAVNGEVVYQGVAILAEASEDIAVLYGKTQVRKEIVDEILASGGEAHFPAGTHLGYGMGDFMVYDFSVDTEYYDHPGMNPFDYFTEEKQQELLALYQPIYDIFKEEGTHPFVDITQGDVYWDEHGALPGVWVRKDEYVSTSPQLYPPWNVISYIGIEKTNQETFWRVLEHPWNIENDLIGLFVKEPDKLTQFHLVDGDLSSGIARIIDLDMHEPENYNPERMDRQYVRFEVDRARNMWDDTLRIEEFTTQVDARAGFTDNAIEFRRGYHESVFR